MPSFLSKVFGRGKKREEKNNEAPASPLGGKFENVRLSPTAPNFDENPSKVPGGKEKPSPTTRETTSKDAKAPHLSLFLSGPKGDATSKELGSVFEADPVSQVLLPESLIGERQLNPLEALVLLKTCGQAIVERGLETLGLMHPHWHSASPEVQRKLISLFIQSLSPNGPQTSLSSTLTAPSAAFESEVQFTRSPHDVAAVFRWGLRHLQLKDPSTFGKDADWYSKFYNKETSSSHPPTAFSDQLAPLVPTSHLELLKYTLETISYIAAHAEGTGVSGSRLTKFIALWLLDPQASRTGETWSELYQKWEKAGRMLEHLFLANIRDEATRHQMPLRLTQLTTQYPYGQTDNTSLLPHPRFTTRAYESLLITLESPFGSETSNVNPVKLVNEAYKASSGDEDSSADADLWNKIKNRSVRPEGEGSSAAVPPLSSIFSDETIRLISLIPSESSASAIFSTSMFNLNTPVISRRRSTSLDSPVAKSPTQTNGNGHSHGHQHQQSVSSTSGSVSERPALSVNTKPLGATDWGRFSQSGFLEDSPMGTHLAATLMDKDVETTNPPPARRRSFKNRGRKSADSPAPPLPSALPTSPSSPGDEHPELENSKYSTKLVKVDEAFIDFWSDSLTDPISSRWPNFFIYRLKTPIEHQVQEGVSHNIEWVVLERTIAKPPPPPPSAEPITPVSSTNVAASGSTPSRPRPASPKPSVGSSIGGTKNRFSLFSSVSSFGKSGSGKKRSTSKKGVPKIGEMGEVLGEEQPEGRRSMTVSKAPENVPIPESPMVEAQRPLPPSPAKEVPPVVPSSAPPPPPPPTSAPAPVSEPAVPVPTATRPEAQADPEEKKDSSSLGAAAAIGGVAGLAAGGALLAATQEEEEEKQSEIAQDTREAAETRFTEDFTPESDAPPTEAKVEEQATTFVAEEPAAPAVAVVQEASSAPEEVATPEAPTAPSPAEEVTPPAAAAAAPEPEAEADSPTTRAPPPAPLNLTPSTIQTESPSADNDEEDDVSESPVVNTHSHMVMAAAAEKYHDKEGHERVVITPSVSVHEDEDPMDDEEDNASIPEQPSIGASTILAPVDVAADEPDAPPGLGKNSEDEQLAPEVQERGQADVTPTVERVDESPEQPPTLEKQDSIFTAAIPTAEGHTLSLEEAIAHAEEHSHAPSPVVIPEPAGEDTTQDVVEDNVPVVEAELPAAPLVEDAPVAAVLETVPEVVADPTPAAEQPAPAIEESVPAVEEPTPTVEEPIPAVEQPTPVVEEPTPAVEEPIPSVEKLEKSAAAVEEPALVVEESTPAVEEPTPTVEVSTPAVAESTPAVDESTAVVEEATPIAEQSTAAVEELTPTVEEHTPVVEEHTSATEEPISQVDEELVVSEVAETTAPLVEESLPKEEVSPKVVEEPAAAIVPAIAEPAIAEQAVAEPVVEEPAAKAEEAAPVAQAPVSQPDGSVEVTEIPASQVEEEPVAKSIPIVEAPTSVEESVQREEENVPVAEVLDPAVEEPVSKVEEPSPVVEAAAPPVEDHVPKVDSVSETAAPQAEEPATLVDTLVPHAEDPAKAVEEPIAQTKELDQVHESAPVVEEPTSAAVEEPSTVPAIVESIPATDEPTPSAETLSQPATAEAPTVEDVSPAPESAEPTVTPSAPIVEAAAPVAEEATPVIAEVSPVALSSALPADETVDDKAAADTKSAEEPTVQEASPAMQEAEAAVSAVEESSPSIDPSVAEQPVEKAEVDDVTPDTPPPPVIAADLSPSKVDEALAAVETPVVATDALATPESSVVPEQSSGPIATSGSDEPQPFVVENPRIEPIHVSASEDATPQDSTELPPVPIVDVAPIETSPVLMPQAEETPALESTPSVPEPVVNSPVAEILEAGETPGPSLALSSPSAPVTSLLPPTEVADAPKAESFTTDPSPPEVDSTPKAESEDTVPLIASEPLVDQKEHPTTDDAPSNADKLEAESSPISLNGQPLNENVTTSMTDTHSDTKPANA